MAYSRESLIRVAKLYYKADKTQNEIANMLDISRQTVGRMLRTARDKGIVKFKIVDENDDYYRELGKKIQARFNLDKVVIEPVYDYTSQSIRESLGNCGSKYLSEVLGEKEILGCSWGRTLLEVVKSIKSTNKKIDVVQLNGSVGGDANRRYNSNEIARLLADKFQGEYYPLPAPGIVISKETKDLLIEESVVKEAMEKAKEVSVAAVGIGALENSLLHQMGVYDENFIKEVEEQNIVGDICLRLFKQDGGVADVEWNDRVIGITLDNLKEIDKVIGIAGGEKKLPAILGSLRGNYLDVLIIDSYTAGLLVQKTV